MDKEQTRAINKKDTRDLNRIGDRLRWIRTTLKLSQAEVARETGIPASSYSMRENGSRSLNIEEFLIMSRYFNSRWPKVPQYFNGVSVDKITVSFLLFGVFNE